MITLTLDEILEAVSGTVAKPATGALAVSSIREPQEATDSSVSFFISAAFLDQVSNCKAAVFVVQEDLLPKVEPLLPATVKAVVKAKDAYLGLARLTAKYAKKDSFADWNAAHFSKNTNIHPAAEVHASAFVSQQATVCEGAKIGANSVVMAGAVVGPQVIIGENTKIFPGVVLYPRVKIGNHVRLHSNAVIGADGFGYAKGPRGSEKIWHLGTVVVGNYVEIGANTCIDRGTLRDSVVEDFAKVDNLVQVGHNGHLKAHSILCAQVGLAGNATVGMGAILAGQAGVADKLVIGDGAIIGPKAGVSKDVPAGTTLLGTLISKPRKEWWKLNAYFDRLPEFYDRLKKLEEKLK